MVKRICIDRYDRDVTGGPYFFDVTSTTSVNGLHGGKCHVAILARSYRDPMALKYNAKLRTILSTFLFVFLFPFSSTSPSIFVVGRVLLFPPTAVSERLANSIIEGNINVAASILLDAVANKDGPSIVRGLNTAIRRQGGDFSVVQTLVRAYGMGLDPDRLERTVQGAAEGDKEAEEVIQRVSSVLEATTTEAPTVSPQSPRVVQTTPIRNGSSNLGVNQETRRCRGQKEIECCNRVKPNSPGCHCETSPSSEPTNLILSCRFEYANRAPLILRDTRRTDHWLCACM